MDLPNITPILSLLWNDKMSVFGTHEETHRGQSVTVYDNDAKITDAQCQISFGTSNFDAPIDNDSLKENILNDATIFCDISLDIKAGDKIIVSRYKNGETFEEYSGIVMLSGFSNKRFSHQEIKIELKGDA
jgi:hypothetical protein